jgi:L-lysine 6-transaminase
VDMVRCQRYLEIMSEEKLIENAAQVGGHLKSSLESLTRDLPDRFSNARGRGLMCAIDLPDAAARDGLVKAMFDRGVMLLPCGDKSIRFRPPLDVTAAEIDEGLEQLRQAVKA